MEIDATQITGSLASELYAGSHVLLLESSVPVAHPDEDGGKQRHHKPEPGQETPGTGVGADSNQVTLLDADGSAEELPLMLKYDVAVHLLDRIRDLLAARDARLGERPARILS